MLGRKVSGLKHQTAAKSLNPAVLFPAAADKFISRAEARADLSWTKFFLSTVKTAIPSDTFCPRADQLQTSRPLASGTSESSPDSLVPSQIQWCVQSVACPKHLGLEFMTISYGGSLEEGLRSGRDFSTAGITGFERKSRSRSCRESCADPLLRDSGQPRPGVSDATWANKGCFVLPSDSDGCGRGSGSEATLFVLNQDSL